MTVLLLVLSMASGGLAASDQRIVAATKARDGAAVRTLIAQHADVNAPQGDGATALHWAAHWDDRDTATVLIHAGARATAADDHGVTPLALACLNGSAAMVDLPLEAGANANAATSVGETPLMTAAHVGNVEVVKLLLAHARALLARGADLNARLGKPLPLLSRFIGQQTGLDVNPIGATPFWLAASVGDLLTMHILVEGGADSMITSVDGTTPLMVAAGVDFVEGQDKYGLITQGEYQAGSFIVHKETGDLLEKLGADVQLGRDIGREAVGRVR